MPFRPDLRPSLTDLLREPTAPPTTGRSSRRTARLCGPSRAGCSGGACHPKVMPHAPWVSLRLALGRYSAAGSGRREPDIATFLCLAEALGTYVAHLVGETDDPAPPREINAVAQPPVTCCACWARALTRITRRPASCQPEPSLNRARRRPGRHGPGHRAEGLAGRAKDPRFRCGHPCQGRHRQARARVRVGLRLEALPFSSVEAIFRAALQAALRGTGALRLRQWLARLAADARALEVLAALG